VVPKAVAGTVVTGEAFRITVPGEWRENVEEGQALQRRVRDARPQAGENGARYWEGSNAKLMLQWARLPGQRAPARAVQAAFLSGLRKSLEPGVVRWDLEETRVTTSVTIEVRDQGSTWRGRASAAVDDQGNLWSVSAMCMGASIPAECAAAVDTLSIAVAEARLLPLEAVAHP
jgi:hypothetical protein